MSDSLSGDVLQFIFEKASRSYQDSVLRRQIKEKFGVNISQKYFAKLRQESFTKLLTPEKASSLAANFSNAVEVAGSPNASVERGRATKSHTPVLAKEFQGGGYYFVPGTGVSQCLGKNTTNVMGNDIEVITFMPVLNLRDAHKRDVPIRALSSLNIRHLAKKDEITALFIRVKNGGITQKMPQKTQFRNQDEFIKEWEKLFRNGNLDNYADIVVHVFKKDKAIPTEIDYANRAMQALAIEHSVVMGQKYEDSLDLVKEISGQKQATNAKLRIGTSPSDPTA